jgi:hypothetical protein
LIKKSSSLEGFACLTKKSTRNYFHADYCNPCFKLPINMRSQKEHKKILEIIFPLFYLQNFLYDNGIIEFLRGTVAVILISFVVFSLFLSQDKLYLSVILLILATAFHGILCIIHSVAKSLARSKIESITGSHYTELLWTELVWTYKLIESENSCIQISDVRKIKSLLYRKRREA